MRILRRGRRTTRLPSKGSILPWTQSIPFNICSERDARRDGKCNKFRELYGDWHWLFGFSLDLNTTMVNENGTSILSRTAFTTSCARAIHSCIKSYSNSSYALILDMYAYVKHTLILVKRSYSACIYYDQGLGRTYISKGRRNRKNDEIKGIPKAFLIDSAY